MNNRKRGGAAAALTAIALALGTRAASTGRTPSAQLPGRSPADPVPAAAELKTTSAYGRLPLRFEVNQGQSDGPVAFLARGQGYSLFLTPTEAVLSLHPTGRHGSQADAVVRMRLADANPHPQLAGVDVLPGTSNYFIGSDPAQWRRDVPGYARVKYSGVYPGVDLIYYGNQRQLEYDIVVAPHADPRRIALTFDGVREMSLDPDGDLVLHTPHGDIAQHKPVIYQERNGQRQKVDGRYVWRGNHGVGFEIADYDSSRALVIDPLLAYATYLGGNGNDIGYAIAVDGAGNAYVAGVTASTSFPGTGASPIQSTWKGSNDVFVTKLNPAGTALVYSTYLGGSGGDTAYAIAVDTAGNAYVTGETDSGTQSLTSIPFPTVGAFDSSYNGGGDAFVTKINAAGNALVYSTFLGGGGNERGYGIAVDGAGNAYVTGHTSSDNASSGPGGGFPTAAPLQANNSSLGNFDAFVTKLNATGNALVYSTYLGGSSSEFSIDGGAIAVDGDGNAYVGGTTRSSNFPGAGSSTIQSTLGGTTGRSDGFVVKVSAAGTALLYSTYLGGSTDDSVNGIAIDAARNAYVVGSTDSPNNFPTASPLQPAKGGAGFDAFVSKINAAGSALVYSTYLGGSDGENAYAVAVDARGNAFVSGWTASSNFPTVAPLQAAAAGSGDAFISELNAAGSALVFSTYLGGQSGTEHAYGIGLDSAGIAYVTGDTNSTNFPTATPFQATRGAGTDAFVARIVGATNRFSYFADFAGSGCSGGQFLYSPSTGQAYTALTNGDGTYTYVGTPLAAGFDTVRTGDFTGDGKADIIVYNSSTAVSYLGTGAGDGGFSFQSLNWSAGYDVVATGDLDVRDATTDVVLYRRSNGALSVGVSNGGGFSYRSTTVAAGVTYIRLADFTGDGKGDLFLYRAADGVSSLGIGDGTGGFAFSALTVGAGYNLADVGDLNGDGKADLFLYNAANGNAVSGISNGTGGFAFTPVVLTAGDTSVRLANYTSDNYADVTVYNKNTGVAFLGTGTGTGTFNFQSLFWSTGYDYVIPEHVNCDGKADVILYDSATGTQYTGISNGNGSFTYTYSLWGAGRMLVDQNDTGAIPVVPAVTVSLNRTALGFAATSSGTAFTSSTGPQAIALTQSAGPAVAWTATSNKPWLVVTPGSGSGAAALNVSVAFDPTVAAAGTATGSITLAVTGATNAVGPITVTLTTTAAGAPPAVPFGSFDTPAGDGTVLAGSIALTGWTLDNIGVNRVELWRDLQAGETTPPFTSTPTDPRNGKVFIANPTFVDGARPDVEALYPTTPFNYRAGWGYLLLTWGLWNQGNGTYKVWAFAFDQENNVATIGSKTIIVDNNAATKPFGSIDTPAIGGDPGTSPNFGWGLTPKVNGAATCKIQSSGVQVSIDSGPLQPVVYGDARSDIAGAFPGFSNSAGAGGHFLFDWSTLTNGPHTIGWLITDDCNRADGVGSRFFTVTTGTNLRVAPDTAATRAVQTMSLAESAAAITVARGFGELPLVVDPALGGSRTIEVKQGERIEIRVPHGFEDAWQLGPDGQSRSLPSGATWDAASGTFSWQPAPGFLGRYRLVFSNGHERIGLRVVITP